MQTVLASYQQQQKNLISTWAALRLGQQKKKTCSGLCWWIFYKLLYLIKDVFKNEQDAG